MRRARTTDKNHNSSGYEEAYSECEQIDRSIDRSWRWLKGNYTLNLTLVIFTTVCYVCVKNIYLDVKMLFAL